MFFPSEISLFHHDSMSLSSQTMMLMSRVGHGGCVVQAYAKPLHFPLHFPRESVFVVPRMSEGLWQRLWPISISNPIHSF